MTPNRLPRPGQVVEKCRLCGEGLDVSTDNPRRVCAHCGEVNLPTDGAGFSEPAAAPAPERVPPLPPPPRASPPPRDPWHPAAWGVCLASLAPGAFAGVYGLGAADWSRHPGAAPELAAVLWAFLGFMMAVPPAFAVAVGIGTAARRLTVSQFMVPSVVGLAVGLGLCVATLVVGGLVG